MRASAGFLVLVLACGPMIATSAQAQGDGSAMAETLFREGRRLMDQKRFDDACPKLAESHRMDPATGTLLALALCHEGQGKSASAWAEYTDAAARARAEGSKSREDAARKRAAALEANLSRLTIRVANESASIEGLEIRRDGVAQPKASWGMAVPVDPGDHVIEASAPGRMPLRLEVKVGAARDSKEAVVPALAVAEAAPPPVAPTATPPTAGSAAPVAPATPESNPPHNGSSGLRTAGWVVGGLGLVGIGIGSYFAVQAMGKKSDSDADCDGNVCGPQAFQDRTDAVNAGNRATIGFVAGGVLAAGGLTMVLLGTSKESRTSIRLAPSVGISSAGFTLHGRI